MNIDHHLQVDAALSDASDNLQILFLDTFSSSSLEDRPFEVSFLVVLVVSCRKLFEFLASIVVAMFSLYITCFSHFLGCQQEGLQCWLDSVLRAGYHS